MAKRFTDSELWNRDWFLNLDGRFQLFCLYLRDQCDHAGVWNPSFKRFEQSTGFRINPTDYISTCNNSGVIRILILENGKWWITGFIEDQYKTKELDEAYNVHKGVINSLRFNQVPYNSYGYNLRVALPSGRLQDKDKDKDKDKIILEGNTDNQQENISKQEGMQGGKEKTFELIETRSDKFKAEIKTFNKYPEEMLKAFYDYWSEPNPARTKMRFEMQKTWETSRRLSTWVARQEIKNKPYQNHSTKAYDDGTS